MGNMEKYTIKDSKDNEVLNDISVSLFEFFDDVDRMKQLYRCAKYSLAEKLRDELAEKLDNIMRGF